MGVQEVGRGCRRDWRIGALALAAIATAGCLFPGMAPTDASPPPAPTLPPGQTAQTFKYASAAGGAVNYLIYLPEGYGEGGKRWPLIVYLHGRSLRGDDVELVKRYGLPQSLEKEPSFPFIVLSPQIRGDQRWTDFDAVLALVDECMKRFPVDPDRVYLTGFSMGGGGAWRLANAHPERFAAVAPLAGTRDDAPITGLKRVPVWAFHGSADEATPVTDSETMVKRITEAGGDARLTVLPGEGHDIAHVYKRQELYDWFLEHQKHAAERPPAPAVGNANASPKTAEPPRREASRNENRPRRDGNRKPAGDDRR